MSILKSIWRRIAVNSYDLFNLNPSAANGRFGYRSAGFTKFLRFCSQDGKEGNEQWVNFKLQKADGTVVVKSGKVGQNIQEIIKKTDYEKGFGGFGACGGSKMCSTCHVILTKEDYSKFPPTNNYLDPYGLVVEMDILDQTVEVTETSRLACVLNVVPEMEGILIKLPSRTVDQRGFET